MTETTHNPLLQKVQFAGETFRLPSGGIFYKNGELSDDVKNGEIHIHPMTAFDEIQLKSPDLLFTGKGIADVFSRCIPGVQKADELLAKDVDFLLVCLRKVSFGSELDVDFEHWCPEADKHGYVVDINEFITNSKAIDPTNLNNEIEFENGQKITFQPMRFKHIVEIMQSNESEDDAMLSKMRLYKTLLALIHDVDGIEDQQMIMEWLDKLPARWVKDIQTKIEEVSNWGPTFSFKTKCKDCGEEIEIAVPLNPMSFFM